VGTYFVLAKYE